MPRLTIRKCWVLVHPDGDAERLHNLDEISAALERVQAAPDEYQVEQRDLVELHPD